MTAITDKRFSVVTHRDVPREYAAFLYRIDVYETMTSEPWHYIGWRKGTIEDVETQKYWHSSRNEALSIALEKAEKIVYNILDFGSEVEMATKENKLLSEVNAVSNPRYFNMSAGGGKHCHVVKSDSLDLADKIHENIKNGVYPIRLYPKKTIENLLNTGSIIQVRQEQFQVSHVQNLRDQMVDKTPDEFEPITLLMPEKSSGNPKIIGGIHSGKAVIKVQTMSGLNAVEIAYKDWSKLSAAALNYLGLLLNPQPKRPSLPNTLDDAANWVMNYILENNLYRNANALPIVPRDPWYNHKNISKALSQMGFGANQKGEISKKFKRLWEEQKVIEQGDNTVNWRDASLLENPRLALWLKNHKKYLMSTKNIDAVIKVSAAQHLWSQIEKSTYQYDGNNNVKYRPKKIVALVFFPDLGYSKSVDWIKAYNTFMSSYEGYSNIMEIELEYLPMLDSDIKYPDEDEDEDNG